LKAQAFKMPFADTTSNCCACRELSICGYGS